jgi:hypothetical protein
MATRINFGPRGGGEAPPVRIGYRGWAGLGARRDIVKIKTAAHACNRTPDSQIVQPAVS